MVKSEIFLGCDLDGVTIDHTAVKIKLAEKFGVVITKFQTHYKDLGQLLGTRYPAFKHELYDVPEIALRSSIMPGAKKVLRLFDRAGIRMAAVSRRRKNFNIPIIILRRSGLWPNIFNERNTFFVLDQKSKNTKAAELGITHFIDDEPDVLKLLTGVKVKYLFDPYNVLLGHPYVHIRSWRELADRILRLTYK